MEKKLSVRDFAAVKRIAQNVAPAVNRKQTLVKKIKAMQAEIAELDAQIAGDEMGVKAKYFGLGTEQLVHREVTVVLDENGNAKIDPKTGKKLTKTTYEPNNCIKYNAEKNEYILTVPEEGESEQGTAAYSEEEFDAAQKAFNDADADAQAVDEKEPVEEEPTAVPVPDDSDPFGY